MRFRKLAAAVFIGTAAIALSACAEQINTTVSRYQAMPAPQGQTFYVVPGGGMANNGGLEFQRYAGIVAQQLQARGYAPASSPQSANMVVQFGYGIDRGQVRYTSDPGFGYGGFYGPAGASTGRVSAGTSAAATCGDGMIPSGMAEGSTATSSIIARSTSTSARQARTRHCSTAARRPVPRRTGSMS